jgi:hypothetical protein
MSICLGNRENTHHNKDYPKEEKLYNILTNVFEEFSSKLLNILSKGNEKYQKFRNERFLDRQNTLPTIIKILY